MTMGFLEWIASIGGVGAVFAVIMFFVYRQTIKQQREDRKYIEDRMMRLTDDYNERMQETNKSRDDNTKVLTGLITWLKAKNGK